MAKERSETSSEERKIVREEGEGIVLEVKYQNYQENHRPDNLPPVYEYLTYKLPTETYKMTTVSIMPNGHRMVKDVHGIYLSVRIVGCLGKVRLKCVAVMLLEMVAFLGIVHWIINCAALNWHKGKKGDEFFEELHQ